ncbi:MAG: hypothetical protein ACREQ7_06650 [Candidatus Binatia bacterium]
MRLPAIMEDILDAWENAKRRPQFKAEYIVTHAIIGSLAEAGKVSAARLKMNREETEALVQRFVGYTREISGPNVNPCRRSYSKSPRTAAITVPKYTPKSLCRVSAP